MTPEEWLRERGIEVARRYPAAQQGQFAGQHTSALPNIPKQDDPFLEELETQIVPSVVRIDLHIRGDVAEWPTAALPDSAVPLDESSEWATSESGFDYSLEDEMTVPLPIVSPIPPAIVPPLPLATEPVKLDDETMNAITNTPTKRLES